MFQEKILKKLRSVRSLCDGVKSDLLNRSDSPKFQVTSLPELNRKIWGMKKGLNVIAGRTSQGKSCLASQIAWDVASCGIPTLILSLEDDASTIIERMFSRTKDIDNYDLETGMFKHHLQYQKEWEEFITEIPKELLVTDGIGSTFEEVNFMLTSLDPKPKCVVIDYIQAVKCAGKNERENLNEYIRQFREICVTNGICGILASQMNRMAVLGEQGEPSLENLKGTGVLEEHSDLVLILKWDYFYDRDEEKKNDFTIYVAKNKRGRTGKHHLRFFPQYSRFAEVPKIQDTTTERYV